MRHRRKADKLSRNTTQRKALLRSLIRSLFLYEQITTTYKRGKAASSLADRLISLGKDNTSTAKKTAISILGSKSGSFTEQPAINIANIINASIA